VRRFPGLGAHDLRRGDRSSRWLALEYGVAIERARQSLEPVLASAYEADLLDVPTGAPLMLERRVSLTPQAGR